MSLAPHPFSLRQLQYAVAVADFLSFRKAAEQCRVSQPSLSAQLAALEQVLGTPLFERDRRRVLLTAAGAELVERARRVLMVADDVLEAAQRLRDPLAGTLRLGVIPTVSPYLLPSAAPALRAAYPRLTLVWTEEKTGVLVEQLERGQIDGAILALEAEIGDVEAEVIARDPFVLATPPGHPLAKSEVPATQADLKRTDVLLLDEGHCLREQALAVCSRARASELEFRATSLPTLVQMVAAGAGVTLLPELSVPVETPRSNLCLRPFAAPAPGRTLALIWRKRSPLGPTLRELAQTVREVYPTGGSAPPRSDRPRKKTAGRARAKSAAS